MKIILGSSSKYRQRVLKEMGYQFEILSSDVDEKAIRFDDPQNLVLVLAKTKAEALLKRIKEPAILITADQVVTCDGEIREKPESEQQAREFLDSYGRFPASTVSAVVVTNTQTKKQAQGVQISTIYFKPLPQDIIEKLITKGEVFHCAGGFRSEDPLVQPYIEKIDGTIDSLMGLPKELTKRLMLEVNDAKHET